MRDPQRIRATWHFSRKNPFPTLQCTRCGYRSKTVRLASEPVSEYDEALVSKGSWWDFIAGWLGAALFLFVPAVVAGVMTGSVSAGIITFVLWSLFLCYVLSPRDDPPRRS